MFEIAPQSEGSRVWIKATGKLTHADYRGIVPRLEARFAEFGPLSLLFDMEGFAGWEPRAAWDDFVLGIRHWGDFRRLAMVGDRKWEEWCARLADRLMPAEVRFFDLAERDAAWRWINE